MNPITPKAVLFDLDGTLLHTAPDLGSAINRMRAHYDLAPIEINNIIAMIGHGVKNLVKTALSDIRAQQPNFDLDAAYDVFAQHYHAINGTDTVAFDGVDETLRELHSRGIPLGIVTNKSAEFVLPLVNQFGWENLFGAVVCGDKVSAKKPHPAPIYQACEQLGVNAQDTLMVGDSMNDVLAAQAAQCRCAVLSYGYNEGVPIRDALREHDLSLTVFDDFAHAVGETANIV